MWLGFGGLAQLLRQESPPPMLRPLLSRIRTRRAFLAASALSFWVALLSLIYLCGPGMLAIRAALPW